MRAAIHHIFRFLPVQLLFLHFRKYQLLLVFWAILFATVAGKFAAVFGASSLFLAPEYQGDISFFSMFIIGGAVSVFMMSWHITTFIIHSHRISYIGATRHSFLKYCINNSIIPLVFIAWYTICIIRYQVINEHTDIAQIVRFQLGFFTGMILITIVSFSYFFRVDRDLLKVVLSRITNPAVIKNLIPYDSLDYDIDIIRADTYLSGKLKIRKCADLEPYSPRLMQTVLRKHHRNAITATIFALLVLWLLGIFIDEPRMRIPAGAGFLLLFAVVMGVVGAMKYFLRSWEVLGWIIIFTLLSLFVKYHVFDVRSIAYGINYKTAKPAYNHEELEKIFTPQLHKQQKEQEIKRLNLWHEKQKNAGNDNAPMIIITVSGGGSRASYWTFRTLQYFDSLTNGTLFKNTVLITGASGGMIGAAYWREVQAAYQTGKVASVYQQSYQDNIGKDLLNAIVFSLVSVDLISPFNKISVAGYSYKKDRGYAMEQEMIRNTEGLLDKKMDDYKLREMNAEIPAMIINGTIINDGKRLMMSALPVGYLTRPMNDTVDNNTMAIDAIDFATFFKEQDPYNLRLTTALRMNATFPYVLPVVRMPSVPEMNIMDAGLRDNFGTEVALRYMYAMKDWIKARNKRVILLQIRDTRENKLFPQSEMNSLASMVSNPLFAIQNKWESFQSYNHSYLKEYATGFFKDNLSWLKMEYIPEHYEKSAALNFHLTNREKKDLLKSVYNPQNIACRDSLVSMLRKH